MSPTGSEALDALGAAAIAAGHDASPVHGSPVPMLNIFTGPGRLPRVTVAELGGFLCWGESWSTTAPLTLPADQVLANALATTPEA